MFRFVLNYMFALFGSAYKIKITDTGYVIYHRKLLKSNVKSKFSDWNKIRKYRSLFDAIDFIKEKNNEAELNELEISQLNANKP